MKTAFYDQAEEAAALLKAIANEKRLLILCYLLAEGEKTVGELVDHIGLSQSALSQHLAKLREEGHVVFRKAAQNIFYRIADPRTEKILTVLHDIFCPELGRSKSKSVRRGGKS